MPAIREGENHDRESAARVADWHRFSQKFLVFLGLPVAFLVGAFAGQTDRYWLIVPLVGGLVVLDGVVFLVYSRFKRRNAINDETA